MGVVVAFTRMPHTKIYQIVDSPAISIVPWLLALCNMRNDSQKDAFQLQIGIINANN